MSSPIRSVGIDLGTTLCSVAYVDDDGRTKMVPNALGEILTPSYVLFEDDAVIVGKEARKHAAILPDRVAPVSAHGAEGLFPPIKGSYMPPE
jgi:molecular chaperone DnaK (HSP70)